MSSRGERPSSSPPYVSLQDPAAAFPPRARFSAVRMSACDTLHGSQPQNPMPGKGRLQGTNASRHPDRCYLLDRQSQHPAPQDRPGSRKVRRNRQAGLSDSFISAPGSRASSERVLVTNRDVDANNLIVSRCAVLMSTVGPEQSTMSFHQSGGSAERSDPWNTGSYEAYVRPRPRGRRRQGRYLPDGGQATSVLRGRDLSGATSRLSSGSAPQSSTARPLAHAT